MVPTNANASLYITFGDRVSGDFRIYMSPAVHFHQLTIVNQDVLSAQQIGSIGTAWEPFSWADSTMRMTVRKNWKQLHVLPLRNLLVIQ